MKLRVGNACWHAFHVQHALLCCEAGFYAQEGVWRILEEHGEGGVLAKSIARSDVAG